MYPFVYMRFFNTTCVYTWPFSLHPVDFSCTRKKWTFLEFWVVWVVMQLTPWIVTNLSSTLYLQKCINRGREVHERDLNHCIVMLEELGLSFPRHCPRSYLLVLQSLEDEFLVEEKQQNQIKVSWGAWLGECILVLIPCSIKMWCPSSSQIIVQCVIEYLFMIRCLC